MKGAPHKAFSLLFRRCHEGGRGEEKGFLNLGAQPLDLYSPLLFPLSPLPEHSARPASEAKKSFRGILFPRALSSPQSESGNTRKVLFGM